MKHYYVCMSVREITVLCHVCKNGIMLVIICNNDQHLVTLHNVIFSNMTCIMSHLSYNPILTQEGSNVPLKLNVLEIIYV